MNLNQMSLSIADALLIQKALHRMVTVVQDSLTAPSLGEKGLDKPRLLLAPLQSSEVSRLKAIVEQLGEMISLEKAESRKRLLDLGEHGYMDGDGILRISDKEYRVFMKDSTGTYYLGTCPNVTSARELWIRSKGIDTVKMVAWAKKPEEVKEAQQSVIDLVDVYVWRELEKASGEKVWETVQWADLEEDPEIQRFVMESNEISSEFPGSDASWGADPEGFRGSDYDSFGYDPQSGH